MFLPNVVDKIGTVDVNHDDHILSIDNSCDNKFEKSMFVIKTKNLTFEFDCDIFSLSDNTLTQNNAYHNRAEIFDFHRKEFKIKTKLNTSLKPISHVGINVCNINLYTIQRYFVLCFCILQLRISEAQL